MAKLATGPAWSSFSGGQQAEVREAFTRFLIADYASEVSDYSGESFVVEPAESPESRGGGQIVKTKLLQPGGRTVTINYLVRGGRVIDVYLNGTVSDLATRRDEFASILAGGGAPTLWSRNCTNGPRPCWGAKCLAVVHSPPGPAAPRGGAAPATRRRQCARSKWSHLANLAPFKF